MKVESNYSLQYDDNSNDALVIKLIADQNEKELNDYHEYDDKEIINH